MSLPVPIVGQENGPAYAVDVNNCMAIIDSHTHAPGSGVQITPNGLNINADLPINLNNLTLVNSIQLSPTTVMTNGTIYESGVDLYYNDGNGNVIQITKSGSVNGSSGTITGLPSGTAGAAYSAGPGTFIFTSATLTPANLDAASVIIRDQTASSNGITLSAPSALASNYSITFPGSLPGAASFMTLDSSGNIAAPIAFANGITASNIANQTITATQIANNTITSVQQATSSTGAFAFNTTTTNTSPTLITSVAINVLNTNSNIYIKLVPEGPNSDLTINNTSSSVSQAVVGVISLSVDGGSFVQTVNFSQTLFPSSNASIPISCIEFVQGLTAGTHTIGIYQNVAGSNMSISAKGTLFVVERA
jgi:hypothetical protein